MIGAQICFWEQVYYQVIPLLRPRLPAMSERLWNQEAGKTFEDFQARFASVDRAVEKILYPVRLEVAGLIAPDDVLFTNTLTVKLTSDLPGTIHYTLSKPWEVLPTAESNAYAGPITLDDNMTVSARLFDAAGKPIGGIKQVRYSKVVPGYKYRLVGPSPITGVWKEMPDFSKLTELRTGILGLMTRDRAEQINRATFAPLSPFANIEVRIPGVDAARTLELNGRFRVPGDGTYAFRVLSSTQGLAELASGKVVIGASLRPEQARITSGKLKAGVYPFTIKYFGRGGGGRCNDLNIQVKGPGMDKFEPFETLVVPVSDWQKPDLPASLPAETTFSEETEAKN